MPLPWKARVVCGCSLMGPQTAAERAPHPAWELWHLALWWAAWSLADKYLIPYSPWPEALAVFACGVVAAAYRMREKDAQRMREFQLAADAADAADAAATHPLDRPVSPEYRGRTKS